MGAGRGCDAWPVIDIVAGLRALRRLARGRRRRRARAKLRLHLCQQEWTWFWTQTFRPEFGVSSGRIILTWFMPMLKRYLSGSLMAVFCATEPHRRSGAWHCHMLLRERGTTPAAYQTRKEWAYNLCGIARVYPFDSRLGVEYACKYILKGHNPWEWSTFDAGQTH